ncbi:MAG: ribosomal protein S18-alanine N-acetyltransferase [Elusimicrobiota bacterium]
MSLFTFSPMTAADAPFLAEIEKEASPSPWSEAQFRSELEKAISRFWTARADGAPAGYAGFWLVEDEAQLANIAVRADLRRRGLGRELLRFVAGEAAGLGAARLTLEVREGNAAARRLYESEGFAETSRRPKFYQGRETAILMEKKIAAGENGK